HADGPALVAEVALDLADHIRGGVRGQADFSLEVVAVDGLEQPDRAYLLDVFERLAATRVAAGKRAHERQVALHELLARARVATDVVALEQVAVGLGRARGLCRRCHGRRTRLFKITRIWSS